MATHISADQTNGEITVHTGRQGMGSKAGHDLVLRVGTWSAKAMLEDEVVTALKVIARLTSLEVVRGEGGLKPLTDKDKATILGHAQDTLKAKEHPELVFEARGLQLGEGTSTVTGEATLAGVTGPLSLEVTVSREGTGATTKARGELLQTAFGITPYSGMLGALKVRDLVQINADLTLGVGSG